MLKIQLFLLLILVSLSDLSLLHWSNALAEVHIVRSTGEYRMGDGDSRAEAKRLALLDAKRSALEKIGTYVQGLVEVKNYSLSKDELQAYTAGMVKLDDQIVRDIWDGTNHTVVVDITASIDSNLAAREISALQSNETAKVELIRLRNEFKQLQEQIDQLKRQSNSSSLTSQTKAMDHRARTLNVMDANEMLSQAWSLLSLLMPLSKDSAFKAKALAQDALNVDPFSPNAHYTLGYIDYYREHNPRAGEEHFRSAVRLDPTNHGYHYSLGQVLSDQNQQPEAITEFEEALRLETFSSKSFSELTGVNFYRNALVEEHIKWGRALEAKEDLEASAKELTAAANIDPRSFGAHAFLADVLEKQGDIKNALAHLLVAHQIFPTGSTHYKLAGLYRRDGQSQQAIIHYKHAIGLIEGLLLVHAHNDLGLLFLNNGQPSEAIAEFRKAIHLKPDDSTLEQNLKMAESQLNRATR